ncbi:MAG: tripartite tricarboxylate transporter substrate binding protein [Propionivibrio sp.]|uniref:Tripartite tricarboxylate transporter substrate binding protein n=1 Tax=Candidatus Propionivibrio dominans TaxID=2954373 RepID=A0A9D7FBD8_9RHOO|nr:tripartite tricarboxylate transporter substrate binding protein [Candidatus Propionivibrio dominans]
MKSMLLMRVLALGLTVATFAAEAQTWPSKPLRVIVPIAPGSMADIAARVVFEQVSTQLGQPIIVENRPGAGQTIGTSVVAKSEPDGYTLLVNSSAHAIAPSLHLNLNYHPARDFAAVIPLGILPNVLVVPPAKGWKTVGELVAAAKATPGAMNYASAGVGTATHLSAERFRSSAGIEAAYTTQGRVGSSHRGDDRTGRLLLRARWRRGASGAGGQAHCARGEWRPTLFLAAGRADYTGGWLRQCRVSAWLGVFLPAKTPRGIVEKLHRETLKALQEPKVKNKLATLGIDPMVMTPTEFDAHVEKEIAVNAALVNAIGLKPQ